MLILTGHSLKDADYTIDFHRGELLREDEKAGHEDEIEKLRRNAVSNEPTMDVPWLPRCGALWDERRFKPESVCLSGRKDSPSHAGNLGKSRPCL